MGHIRSILERLSQGRSFWRRLPAPYNCACVRVTPDAALSFLKPGQRWCDEDLISIASHFIKVDDVVWDIGANVGLFGTLAAVKSGAGGHVLCVEPDLELARLIGQTSRRLPSNCAPIDVVPAAVAGVASVAEFLIAKRGRASNALAEFKGRSQMGGVRERRLVPTVKLDMLLQVSSPPVFVKIDVEGAENAVLSGACELLQRVRPTIYIEVGEQNLSAVTAQFLKYEYSLFDLKELPEKWTLLEECRRDTIAIPRERVPT